MGGIGVILNPRSKRNLGDPRAAVRLARALGDHGVVRTVKSKDDLSRIAEDFRRQKIDVLGISGGDGTNYVTITGFLQVYDTEPLPPLAFLRGGTFNTVANSVGVPSGSLGIDESGRTFPTTPFCPLRLDSKAPMQASGENPILAAALSLTTRLSS